MFHFQVIPNITRKYHDGMVKCEVHNAVGKSEESEALDISCKWNATKFILSFLQWKNPVVSHQSPATKFQCDIFHFQFADGPVFKTRPKSIEADNGSTIVLTCDVTGNPAPDILWIHEPNDKVKAK